MRIARKAILLLIILSSLIVTEKAARANWECYLCWTDPACAMLACWWYDPDGCWYGCDTAVGISCCGVAYTVCRNTATDNYNGCIDGCPTDTHDPDYLTCLSSCADTRDSWNYACDADYGSCLGCIGFAQ